MGKILLTNYTATNKITGVPTPGLILHCYPFGTQTNDAFITDNGDGTYTILHNPETYGDGVISRFYDIYIVSTMKVEKVPIGDAWIWIPPLSVTTSPQVVAFASLKDEGGVDYLPTTILNAKLEIMYAEKDLDFHITALSDTGFTIVTGSAGSGSLPCNVHLRIFVGEA